MRYDIDYGIHGMGGAGRVPAADVGPDGGGAGVHSVGPGRAAERNGVGAARGGARAGGERGGAVCAAAGARPPHGHRRGNRLSCRVNLMY